MNSNRYRRVKEIFFRVCELPEDERDEFLKRHCADDAALKAEVCSLLEYHRSQTILSLPPSPAAATTVDAKSDAAPRKFRREWGSAVQELLVNCLQKPLRRYSVLLAIVLMLAGVGYWMYRGIQASLDSIVADDLQTILDADVTALELWMEDQKTLNTMWVRQRDVQEASLELAEIARQPGFQVSLLLESSALERIRRELAAFSELEGNAGFALIDRSGLVLAAEEDHQIGIRLGAEGIAAMAAVFAGEVRISKPHPRGTFAADQELRFAEPVVWTSAPVKNAADEVVAVLGFGWEADHDFSRILSVARIGESGETYVFDEHGLLLSESRFDDQLREVGLIPDEKDARSLFRVHVRDPGGNLIAGFRPTGNLADRPLTKIAETALAASRLQNPDLHQGVILNAYRDYRGVEVVGAWRWLKDYNMVIVTEVDRDEAYALLRYPLAAFWIRSSLLAAAVCGLLAAGARIAYLKREMGVIRQLGQYALLRKIGEGGMGEVYLARHALLRRPTAVKILKGGSGDDDDIRRFEREVQLASELTHPHTIEIYDYGRTADGVFYYAMEYLPGISLTELVSMTGPIPAPRTVHVLIQICGALKEAHGVGLVHRDIKPQNIILCNRGGEADFAKLVDFGLVKQISGADSTQVTQPTVAVGTPLYMAPEALTDPCNIDARSDIYALGAVAFFMLTGREIFTGESRMDLFNRVMNDPPPRPAEQQDLAVPEELDRLVVDCLQKDRERRPPDAQALLARLEHIAATLPWTTEEAEGWWKEHETSLNQTTAIASLQETLDNLRTATGRLELQGSEETTASRSSHR